MSTEQENITRQNRGGSRKGAGRPKKHKEDEPVRTLWLRATDDEWSQFLAKLPSDARERFVVLNKLANHQTD